MNRKCYGIVVLLSLIYGAAVWEKHPQFFEAHSIEMILGVSLVTCLGFSWISYYTSKGLGMWILLGALSALGAGVGLLVGGWIAGDLNRSLLLSSAVLLMWGAAGVVMGRMRKMI